MLSEKRVRHMVKLASYESKEGAEEIKISSYFKKDYLSYNVWISLLWTTLGYGSMAALLCLAYLKDAAMKMDLSDMVMIVAMIVIGYLLALLFYGVLAVRHYKKKHHSAKMNVKMYLRDLDILEKMYEREDM